MENTAMNEYQVTFTNGEVVVIGVVNRLEVWNPGELPSALTVTQLSRAHALCSG